MEEGKTVQGIKQGQLKPDLKERTSVLQTFHVVHSLFSVSSSLCVSLKIRQHVFEGVGDELSKTSPRETVFFLASWQTCDDLDNTSSSRLQGGGVSAGTAEPG